MKIQLLPLSSEHTIAFKEEMQESFQHGSEAYNKDAEETNQWQVLPDKDFYQSLEAVVRSRQLHIYRNSKKVLVLAGKAAPKIIREDGLCEMIPEKELWT